MIEVQLMFIVHDMLHEIVNNNSQLSINIVGKKGRFLSLFEGLVVAEVILCLGWINLMVYEDEAGLAYFWCSTSSSHVSMRTNIACLVQISVEFFRKPRYLFYFTISNTYEW